MITRIVFWQNIISPHYAPLFKALSKRDGLEIILVAEAETTALRKNMGWSRPDTGNTQLIVNPSKEEIKQILIFNSKNSAHIFSGTRAYPKVWQAFKYALNLDLTIGFLGETGNWFGIKGKLRLLRGKYDSFLLRRKIKYILANGQKAVDWYLKCGYPPEKIFDWAYFVDRPESPINPYPLPHVNKVNLLYIGRLSPEKGIDFLLKALHEIKDDFHLTIVGEGPEKNAILNLIEQYNLSSKVDLMNFVPQKEVFSIILSADTLILPSTGKDGWGAVINESLLMGTPVIVSSNCGASDLIKKDRGIIFNPDNYDEFLKILSERIQKGKTKESQRTSIKDWSIRIEGEAGASYVLDLLHFSIGQLKNRPNAPWIEN